jgi:hypothetical protein
MFCTHAEIPAQAVVELAAHTGRHRDVTHVTAKPRREATREDLLEREALVARKHFGQCGWIGHVVSDRNGRAARGRTALSQLQVADQQRLAVVAAEYGGTRIRVTEVETAVDKFL